MSVALDTNTITTTLWPSSAEAATKSTGIFLEVNLVAKGTPLFTHIAFDPDDEAKFYAATTEAVVYMFSLRGNVVRLFATFAYPVSAMTYCNTAADAFIVCATEDLTLLWLDCSTSRIARRTKTPHSSSICTVRLPADFCLGWMITLSRETLSVWDSVQMTCRVNSHMSTPNLVYNFVDLHVEASQIVTVEHSGIVREWDPFTLLPRRAVIVGFKPRVAAGCRNYIAVGGAGSLVGFLKLSDLSSLCCIQVCKTTVPTRSLSIINDDLLVCELADGNAVFVVVSNYTVAFAINAPPRSAAVSGKQCFFTVSGPSFGVCVQGGKLSVFYLPVARQYYMKGVKKKNSVSENNSQHLRRLHSFCHTGDKKLLPLHLAGADDGCGDVHNHDDDDGCLNDTTLPRPSIRPSEKHLSNWTRVDLLLPSSIGAEPVAVPSGKMPCGQPPVAAKERKEVKGGGGEGTRVCVVAGNEEINGRCVMQRSFLDKASRVANMENLKNLLLRYGVFPEKYRPLIWRFLLQLPERRFTAPQYSQLLSKGVHCAVNSLMKPFPLSNKKERSAMESVLSVLAWHEPVFSVIHFLPLIVYPFLQVYKNDTQSTVETVLVFMSNWGQEFFQYYPHYPVDLMTLLSQFLRTEDAELHKHLELCGIMVESWEWEALRSLYTDILTSAAWLQVMDHAFFNRPVWLFLFHIQWLVHIREKLLRVYEQQELMDVLTTTHPVNIRRVVADTYYLYERYPKGELTEPYEKIGTFINYVYPLKWRYDKKTITEKLRDFQHFVEQDKQTEESCRRVGGIYQHIAEAEKLENVAVERKRAQVAAQLSTANETLKNEVVREKETQRVRELEHAARIEALQQKLQQAALFDAYREELNSVQVQLADIQDVKKRETLHWRRAEQLTENELQRLEQAANEILLKAKSAVDEAEKKACANVCEEGRNSGREPQHAVPFSETSLSKTEVPIVHVHVAETPSDPVSTYRMLRGSVTREVNKTPPSLPHGGNQSRWQFPFFSSPSKSGIARGSSTSSRLLYDNMIDEGTSRCIGDTKRSVPAGAQRLEQRYSSDADKRLFSARGSAGGRGFNVQGSPSRGLR